MSQSSMKETRGLVCWCGTWCLKQAEIFSRPLNFSSPVSSSEGEQSFLSWGGRLWKVNAGELQLQQWSLNTAATVPHVYLGILPGAPTASAPYRTVA